MDNLRSTGSSPTSINAVNGLDPVARQAWSVGAISLCAAVILGAFGAHALEDALPADRMDGYRTASQYHFYSCFFLFALALTYGKLASAEARARLLTAQRWWGWGTVIFCSSVYLVSVRGVVGLESSRWLGAIAPVGGMLLILGAGMAAYALLSDTRARGQG